MGQQSACSRNEAEGAKILCLYNSISSHRIYIFPNCSGNAGESMGTVWHHDDYPSSGILVECLCLVDDRDRSDFLRELGLPGGLDKG